MPKGDLDASGSITGPRVLVDVNSQLFPYGTAEQYPIITNSNGTILTNTAHEYVECSNKGTCNRARGVCMCLPGYWGSACQRVQCPIVNSNVCNRKGMCVTARTLAQMDHDNTYELWDADVNMACLCDPGYSGPACTFLTCKAGFDPLFLDREGTRRFSNYSYVIYSKSSRTTFVGNYSIDFYDVYNNMWKTVPISYNATCLAVINALEGLPNNVIPFGSVRCSKWDQYHFIPAQDEPIIMTPNLLYGIKYTLAFPMNPGILKPPSLDVYLDGYRPTLFTYENVSTLSSFVYTDGFAGEDTEFFTQKCLGVDATLPRPPPHPPPPPPPATTASRSAFVLFFFFVGVVIIFFIYIFFGRKKGGPGPSQSYRSEPHTRQ